MVTAKGSGSVYSFRREQVVGQDDVNISTQIIICFCRFANVHNPKKFWLTTERIKTIAMKSYNVSDEKQ